MLIGLALSACIFPGKGEKSTLTSVTASLQYYDPRLNAVSNEYYPSEVLLAFPAITGAIFGAPQKEPLAKQKLDKTRDFELALSDILPEIADVAKPMSGSDGNTGLHLSPSTVKVARLSTFIYDTLGRVVGAGSFVDPQTNEYLLLSYFSEPAKLDGTLDMGGDKYIFKVIVRGSGFHWLRVVITAPRQYEIRADSDYRQPVHFAVQVRDSAHL